MSRGKRDQSTAAPRKPASRKPKERLLQLTKRERAALEYCYRLRPVARRKVDSAVDGPVNFTKYELCQVLDEIGSAFDDCDDKRWQALMPLRDRVVELLEQDAPEAFGVEHLAGSPKTLVRSDLYFQFRIELENVEPPVWRRIRMQDCPLGRLHNCIQAAFGWEDYHLHEFVIGGLRFAPRPPEDFAGMGLPSFDEEEPLISQLVPHNGRQSTWRYIYDFGDDWHHRVIFEGCQPVEPRKRYPYCVDGARACPPEDTGGPWGYAEMLHRLARPKSKRDDYDEQLQEWFAGFDPEAFSAKQATAEMRRWLRAAAEE
jgi:hypothetical protein